MPLPDIVQNSIQTGQVQPTSQSSGIPDFLRRILTLAQGTLPASAPLLMQNQQQPKAPQPQPVQPQAAPQPQAQATISNQPTASGGNLKELLLRLGIPVGAAIAGSVNPGFLPQAAGLATGYQGQISEQDKLKFENELTQKKQEQDRQPTDFDIEKEARQQVADLIDPILPPSAEEYKAAIEAKVKEIKGRLGPAKSTPTSEPNFEQKIKGAPSAKEFTDGSVLKDSKGNDVAISRGGVWQPLQ